MSVSSIGVGSGLPLATLLDNLRINKEAQLTSITSRQKKAESRVSAYGQLKSDLESFSKAATALNEKSLDAVKATVTGEDFTATASAGAVAANYNISVVAMAKAQSLVMQGATSRTENIGTGGVITFKINGEDKQLDLTGKGTSLEAIVKAINADKELGFSASIINNGSTSPYQLVLTAKTTGTEASITEITVDGNEELNDLLKFGVAGSTVHENPASNAEVVINGITVTSQTNTLKDTIDGVTITLTGESGKPGSLTVEQDSDSIVSTIESFVNSYNNIQKRIKQLTSYNIETQSGAALVGDSIARSIQTRLSGVLNTPVQGGAFTTLSQIGIKTGSDGLLTIDKTKLTEAVTGNIEDVKNLFQSEKGIANLSIEMAKVFTDSSEGILTKTTESVNKSIKLIKDEYDRATQRIDAEMETLRKQYSALDSLIAQMNSLSSQLSQQLSALANMNSSSKK